MGIVLYVLRQTHRFRAEQQDVTRFVGNVHIRHLAIRGERKDAFRLQRHPCGVEVGMDGHYREVMVVQPRTAQFGIGEVETQGLNEVEFGAGDGREADCIAGIAGDLRGVEEDAEHRSILVPVDSGQCMPLSSLASTGTLTVFGAGPEERNCLRPLASPAALTTCTTSEEPWERRWRSITGS